MEQSFFNDILAVDLRELIMTSLRLVHFFGLAVGLGSATLLDFIILRFMVQHSISREGRDIVVFGSRFITLGLAMLWLSGAGFLVVYAITDPDLLSNPKIWAKLMVVVVLTINGVMIHRLVLPIIGRQVEKALFHGLTRRQHTFLLACGAISVISWYTPVVLAAAPQLNFVVPAAWIIGTYLTAILTTALFFRGAISFLVAPVRNHAVAHALPRVNANSRIQISRPVALSQSDGGRLSAQSLDAALEEALGEAETILRDRLDRITLVKLSAELRARKAETRRAS